MALTKRVWTGFEGGYGWRTNGNTLAGDVAKLAKFVNSLGDGNLSPGYAYNGNSVLEFDYGAASGRQKTLSPTDSAGTNFFAGSFFLFNIESNRAFKYTPVVQALELSFAQREVTGTVTAGKELFWVQNKAIITGGFTKINKINITCNSCVNVSNNITCLVSNNKF